MSDHNPFDRPPTTPPSAPPAFDITPPGNPIGPRQNAGRGKMAVVVLAAAGLTGGAILGISQLAGADDPTLETTSELSSAGSERVGVSGEPSATIPDDLPDLPDMSELPAVFDDLAECLNLDELFASMPLGELGDGSELPSFDFGPGSSSVTVTGPDGMTVYSLGEGDGSITINKSGDELTVSVDGDVSESMSFDYTDFNLDEMFADLEGLDFENFDFENFDLDQFLGGLDVEHFDQSDLPAASLPDDVDLDQITRCFEQLDLSNTNG